MNESKLLFTTRSNVKHLKKSSYYIINGNFRIVPTLFQQLYTIHAIVGTGKNAKILPLRYVLLTSKTEKCYTLLFEISKKMN